MTADKMLELARAEIGVKESPPGSNKVKYNTAYYGREVSGSNLAWCVVFIWWLFQQGRAPHLFFGGEKTASCTTLYSYHAARGQAVSGEYRAGDIIFYNFRGGKSTDHVGICESWDGKTMTSIEGNTSLTSQDNGGAVMRRQRTKGQIVAAYRPFYAIKEEEKMTGKEIYEALQSYLSEQRIPDWAAAEFREATDLGITDGTNGMQMIPRYQAAIMAKRALVRAQKEKNNGTC